MFPEQQHITVHSTYFSRAVDDIEGVTADAKRLLADVDFDTLVGTGLSGSLVVPHLARELGVNWLLIRKPNDGTHGDRRGEGRLGRRWIFVDDFIASGATYERVSAVVGELSRMWAFGVVHVGDFLYQDIDRPGIDYRAVFRGANV